MAKEQAPSETPTKSTKASEIKPAAPISITQKEGQATQVVMS